MITAFLLGSTAIASDQTVLEHVREACKADKEKFCSTVTPGDTERMLACAYAHEDQLSWAVLTCTLPSCKLHALEAAVAALNYIAERMQR